MKSAVLFDLDGTLTNPREGITKCIRHALGAMGQPVPPEADLDAWIGPPLRSRFAEHLGSETLADEALGLYRKRFSSVGLYENKLYDDTVV